MLNHACPELEGGVRLHVDIQVRPAYRPSRWAWYAVDCESSEVVEYAFEYDSPLAARRAGLERLKELTSSLDKAAGGTLLASRLRSLSAGAQCPPVKRWRGSSFPIVTKLAEARLCVVISRCGGCGCDCSVQSSW